jgi:pyrroline-5-carboxylate reductase
MLNKSFGFIGGGRVVKILLNALSNKNMMPAHVVVSDSNEEVLKKLKNQFPQITIAKTNTEPAKCDLVFISLHPPVFVQALNEIKESVRPESVIISLAPKISIAKIQIEIPQVKKVVRMIPNAPTYINKGYNPVAYSKEITDMEKTQLAELFSIFGEFPEVEEYNLEAYAIVAAMGPTYLWFQIQQIKELALSFGLSETDLKRTLPAMIKGAVDTMFDSGLPVEEVIDLVPVKPLADDEPAIKNIYKTKLEALFAKLKS